jgi:ribosomal protein S14
MAWDWREGIRTGRQQHNKRNMQCGGPMVNKCISTASARTSVRTLGIGRVCSRYILRCSIVSH